MCRAKWLEAAESREREGWRDSGSLDWMNQERVALVCSAIAASSLAACPVQAGPSFEIRERANE